MFFVYILFSKQYLKTYIGFTSNIEARISAHNHPINKGWTKRYQPSECLYHEAFQSKKEAMKREIWFKSGVGRKWIAENILH
jgi:putative endonuclease